MRTALALALLVAAGVGCARHYVITLNNGTQLSTRGKPHLEGGYYVYTDILGRKTWISSGRVSEVAPASMMGSGGPVFNGGSPR
jgi:Bacterial protein of unknown function (DUF903)